MVAEDKALPDYEQQKVANRSSLPSSFKIATLCIGQFELLQGAICNPFPPSLPLY